MKAKKRNYSYGDLLNIGRELDSIKELDKQFSDLLPQLSSFLGKHVALDCTRPIYIELYKLFISKTSEYNKVFEEYYHCNIKNY